MWQWRIVFGVLVGLYLAFTPPGWAQGVVGSTVTPGDEGTEACREVQLAVQSEVGEETNPPYRNHGQYVRAAAHAANPALEAGEITEACHSCIVSQFAKSIPIANQEACGPDPEPELCDLISCDDNDACTEDACDPELGCFYTLKNCDDDNACTEDACDPELGCVHISIDNCT